MLRKIANLFRRVREYARDYEPAVAAAIVAAVFQLLAGLGIAVGDLPEKVDAVLAFLAVAATLVAGRATRARVFSRATLRPQGRAARRGR